MSIQVSAQQSVQIFGWWDQPRHVVVWDDLKKLTKSWHQLRNEFKFTADQLHKIQPDKKEWIQRGALTLHDLPEMTLFPINPFTDLGADIAEVWSMHWSVDLLACMGVSFLNMRQRGLSAQLMHHFQIPLSGWLKLRLNEKDIQNMTDDEIDFVFQIDRHEIVDIIKSHMLCKDIAS